MELLASSLCQFFHISASNVNSPTYNLWPKSERNIIFGVIIDEIS